ncbi:MAG: formate dehydrogenase accessory sulfurtransferase FdhD [Thermoanaerobaculia bacterium]|nr:formate dehydrogenase accessory sulfurtransferase FdhD [Thermoanaerobaculia bacterium]
MPSSSTTPHEVLIVQEGISQPVPDELATEEPLEIRLATDSGTRPVAITMRTPGNDRELALGFLFAEGVIRQADEVVAVERPSDRVGQEEPNILVVRLAEGRDPDLKSLDRHFFTSSACGVCGKAGIEALLLNKQSKPSPGPRLDPEILYSLPEKLRRRQSIFQSTGGLHAAALFSPTGELAQVREDVGRHNALDKLVGWALEGGRLPLADSIVMVSGRTSYEILQKCLMADVPVVCAVSAPSSLAVSLARQFGITLVGFLRDQRMNVYSGRARLGL